jgi:hypothetical protein
MAGVDRSTPMPVPITAGADHTTHMPDPVGVDRPLYAYAGGPYWGWRRPLYAAAVTTGVGFNPWYGGWNPGYAGGPYYAYAGMNTWRGWGWSNTWW